MAKRICRRVDGITITQKKNKNDYSVSKLSESNTNPVIATIGILSRIQRRDKSTSLRNVLCTNGILHCAVAPFRMTLKNRQKFTASILTFVMLFQIVAGIFAPVNIFNLSKPMVANAGWFDAGYGFRKEIKIDHTKVAGDLANFPMLVSLTDVSLKTTANGGKVTNSSGYDIIFINASGSQKLDHEIEKYDGSTGEIVMWVKIPALSASTDTGIYMYYGNSAVTVTQENKTGVWDDGGSNNFKMVQHMNQDPGGTAPQMKDSTSNTNNGTSNGGMATDDLVNGKIGGSLDFDGMNDVISFNNTNNFAGDLTFSSWFYERAEATPYGSSLVSQSYPLYETPDPGMKGANLYLSGNTAYTKVYGSGVSTSTVGVGASLNSWHQASLTISGTTLSLYLDGTFRTSNTITGRVSTTDLWIGGEKYFNLSWFPGSIDEVRISNTARSAEWISTEYNNQSNPTEFSSLGIEEVSNPLSLSSFKYRKAITIDKTKVSGSLNNFPVLINLPTDASLAANAQDDNDDILFTSSNISWTSGTINDKLAHEVESFNGTTGSLQAWVKLPNISSANDTVIYMYYGHDTAATQQNKTAVWDSNTRMVQHMNQNPGGGAPQMKDSTQYANNGISNGGMTSANSVAGQVDGATSFDGTDDYVDAGNNGSLNFTDSITIESWVKINSLDSHFRSIVEVVPHFPLKITDTNKIRFQISTISGINSVLYNTPQTNVWYHLIFTYDSNDSANGLIAYVNGARIGSSHVSGGKISNIGSNWKISTVDAPTYPINGSIDEVRISNTARSAEWISTEYNNQSNPTEFSSLGIEEVSTPLALSYFGYRKAITIDHTKVAGNLTNFPVLINLPTDASLQFHAQGDADDILFTSSSTAWNTGTVNDKLAHEVESYNSANGSLQAWVKIPNLSSTTDTVIYMYYGNGSVASQQNKTVVWDGNTKMVQHMNQSGTGAIGDYKDSTQYGNNSTNTANQPTVTTSGQIGNAESFDGSNSTVIMNNGLSLKPSSISVSAWVKLNSDETRHIVAVNWTGYSLEVGANGRPYFKIYNGTNEVGSYSPSSVIFEQWQYITGEFNSVTKELKIFLNGIEKENTTNVSPIYYNYGNSFQLSSLSHSGGAINGSIDEVRISNTVRSAEWVATEYNNQSVPLKAGSTPNGFVSLSAEQIYRLEIIGAASQTVGTAQTVTLNAKDVTGATMSDFTGDKVVIFSGANAAPDGTVPTCSDKDNVDISFGMPATLAFANGVAHCNLKLYKAETATITSSSISGSTTNLLVIVSPNILNNFLVDAPNSSNSGSAFATTITSRDLWHNTTKAVTGITTLSTNYGILNNNSISQDNFTDDGIWTGNLTIANVNEQPSAALTATNGTSTGTDNISILGIPNSPAPASASRNTDYSFTLTWQDTSTVETGYKIERKTNDAAGFSTYTQIGTVAANISAFTDDTTTPDRAYQYRVRAYNTIGNSAYAEDAVIHYTTPDMPSNVFSTRNSDTSFTVNYTDNANVTDIHHIQRCSNANCTAAFETDLNTFTSSPQTDTTNIAPDSGYRWQVRAEAPGINSNYTVSAFEYTTPNAPVIQDAAFISSTQINVNWQDASAYEDGFRIEVSIDGGAYQEITPNTNTAGANSTSYAFVSQADHNYKFRIKSHIGSTPHNSELLSAYSGESNIVYTTSNAPIMQTPIVNSSTSITWNWTDTSAFEEAFHLHFTGLGTNVDNISASTTNYETTNLLPNTAYQTHIHSYRTDTGESASSASPEIYTFAVTPLPPTLVLGQQNRITVTRVADTNPTATEYLIENVNDGTNSDWITSPSWTTAELHCETEYSFHIKARNHSNIKTDYSSLATLKTGSCGTPLPAGAHNPPATPSPTTENPAGGFKIIINNNDAYTKTGNVKLTLSAGTDTARMAISNSKDFSNASMVPYQKEAIWNLNAITDDVYTVYAKFYTQYGVASQIVSDTIMLDTAAPILNLANLKDKYLTTDNTTIKGTTEPNSKIIYNLDSIRAGVIDVSDGNLNLNLGTLTEGTHSLQLVAQDGLGNSSDTMQFFLNVEKPIIVPTTPTVPNTSITPTDPISSARPKPAVTTPTNPTVAAPTVPQSPISQSDTEVPNIATPNIPNPDTNNPDTTTPDVTVTPEPPVSMQGDWNLLSIQPFPKDITSEDIQMIIEKFPEFKDIFKNLGITDFSDADKLKNASFNIPNLSEVMGLNTNLTVLNLPAANTPLAELSAQFKKDIPSNIVFVKTKNSNFDVSSVLAFDNGNPDQKISLLSNQSFQLILKPDQEVNSIQGYLTFKESKLSRTESSNIMQKITRLLKPNRALADENIEEKLVLSQFDYQDADQDGIWTADISTPQVSGEYELITVLNYKDVKIGAKTLRLITVVDPEGYVYRTDADGIEARIPNATVSIYWFNTETKKYELWDTTKYQQQNPQVTDNRGTYSFLVPPGSYYLKVEAAGYSTYQSDPFDVTVGGGVHMNLELKRQADWKDQVNWQNLLLVVFGVALFYNFYSDRKMRKRLKTTEIV